jgi:hypothetical protein
MYRAVEGQALLVGGSGKRDRTIRNYWDDVARAGDKLGQGQPAEDLGPLGGLVVTYALLLIAFLLVVAQEKRFFRRRTDTTIEPGECSMKEIVPDYRLDMIGEPCPYPAVATLEALPQLRKVRFWKW